MGIKSTRRVSRQFAIEILTSEIASLPNDALADMMDALADCGHSHRLSYFDNFIVSEFNDEDSAED